MEKDVLSLDGQWEFKEFPETARRMRDLEAGGWMPAAVPASIYTCLAEAGVIDHAQLNAKPEQFQWVSGKSWIFRKKFDVSASLMKKEQINLVFKGLDTVTQIWLNDKLIGKTENMFIPHQFDITDRLKPSNNVLLIKFRPALKHAEQLMQRYGTLSEHHFGDIRRSYVRKAQYQFGSVMGPALVGYGIFRSIGIEGFQTARIDHLHIRTVDCNQHYADIRIAIALKRTENTASTLQGKIHLTGGGLDIKQELEFSPHEDHYSTLIRIERPILWWPKGYGVQHQYHLHTHLFQGQMHLDTVETDFGIRTIRVNRAGDEYGTKFQFVVNEQPIEIKGANWMPLSIFPGRQTEKDYEFMLQQAVNAHFNMLRVWAGGFYENSDFYCLCDKLGILIWQDFMFASAYYPDRQWFTQTVKEEAQTMIEQLRNHACLALWCGNSRIDSLHEDGRLGTGRKFYGKAIYHELIPALLNELDPDCEYIPTTPFSDSDNNDHHDPASGTTHNWNVWNHYADRSEYETPQEQIPRFVTEFGIQSLPHTNTLSTFGLTQNTTPGALAIEKHNYQPGGQQRIARYIVDDFVLSSNLTEFIWQSQVTQARAVKKHVEHLRSHNAINNGCLIWTFNDPAPSIAFSMIDALGYPKALYYYAKRFFAPILIALTPSRYTSSCKMAVINDSPHRITATLDCRILDFSGNTLDQLQIPVASSPFSGSTFYSIPRSFMQSLCPSVSFLHMKLFNEDSNIAENSYFFEPDKYLQCSTGDIELEIIPKQTDAWQVKLASGTVIRDLQIIPPDLASLSDNFFDLVPGYHKEIKIQFTKDAPSVWTPIQILSAQ